MPSSKRNRTLSFPVIVTLCFSSQVTTTLQGDSVVTPIAQMKRLKPEWLNVLIQLRSGRIRI